MGNGRAQGTRAERLAAHLREREEHSSEEGLAIVNQYLAEADQRLWWPALKYYAAALASEVGFRDLFAALGMTAHNTRPLHSRCTVTRTPPTQVDEDARSLRGLAVAAPYVSSEEKRWGICARAKGGLTDTGRPGAFCRDQAYWMGAIVLLRKRATLDLVYMHMGKVNIAEADRADHGTPFAAAIAAAATAAAPAVAPAEGGMQPALMDQRRFIFPGFLADLEGYRHKLDAVAKANLLA